MLYNSLIESASIDPKDKETTLLIKQYEEQRKHFLARRLNELKSFYGITDKEERVLLGYFNTEERGHTNDTNSDVVAFKLMRVFKHHKDDDELTGKEPGFSAALGWHRIYWTKAWCQFAQDNKFLLSARFALIENKNSNQSEDFLTLAIEELIRDLKTVLLEAESAIGLPLKHSYFLSPSISTKGILSVDTKKLKWLIQHNIGNATKTYIETFKHIISSKGYDVEHRLDVWDNPLYFSRQLASLRWQDRIEKLANRKQINSPALTYQFYTQITEATKRETKILDNSCKIVSKEGKFVSSVNKAPGTTISTMEQITRSTLPLLASITSHYLWRWFIEQAHKQHLLDMEQPYKIEIIGGFPRLGELSEAGKSREAIQRIKKIIELSSMCSYLYEGKTGEYRGNLLSFEHFEAYGRKTSKLTINLARPLCPGFVEELPEGNSKYNHQKMLVPWVKMPKLVGRNLAHHAPQSSFQLDMVAKMRLRACEIYERGGILLNDSDLIELAKGAKLSANLIDKVVDTWVQEEYLERIDDCIYMLGKRYPDARQSLFMAGELSTKSAERGRKRKKDKNSKLTSNSLPKTKLPKK